MSDNMKFLADALAYHTKGRKAFMESKCSCCNNDPCDCSADCDCKKDVKEGADEVNDTNINSIHDKDEDEATDNTVKMTNDIIAGKQPYTKPIKSIYEPVKEDLDELLGHTEDLYEMVMELDEMLKEEDMSLSEAFHALSEDLDEDMLDEDFAKMSKTKQLIARRKAGRRKKLTVGYKLNKNKLNIPNKPK